MWTPNKLPANRGVFREATALRTAVRRRRTLLCSRTLLEPEEALAAAPWTARSSRQPRLSGPRSQSRLQGALNDTTYRTWFAEAGGRRADRRHVHDRASPNDFTREWIESHFLGLIQAAVPRLDRPGAPDPADGQATQGGGRGAAVEQRRALGRRARRAEPEVHLRPVRDRLVEPVRARGRARRRRGAGAGLQPALHLRRHRAREDAPDAGDRAVRRASTRASSRCAT